MGQVWHQTAAAGDPQRYLVKGLAGKGVKWYRYKVVNFDVANVRNERINAQSKVIQSTPTKHKLKTLESTCLSHFLD
jgi:hypothetical protein